MQEASAENGEIYLGFWLRSVATILDNLLLGVVLIPLYFIFAPYDSVSALEALQNVSMSHWTNILSVVVVLVFWHLKQATPGKMLFKARIVDAKTGSKPRPHQWVLRYIGYLVSIIPLGLGFLWVAFDKKKRGWHDMIAGTVVIVDTTT